MSSGMSLGELLNKAVEKSLSVINTAIPARVVSFDGTEKRVDVQPLIRKVLPNGDTVDYPTIMSVPVQYPSSSKAMVYFPLEKGDPVLLVISQTSLDNWSFANHSKPVDPDDARRFDISDAIAIPCAFPFPLANAIWESQVLTKDINSVIIKHNIGTASEAEVALNSDGSINIESQSQLDIKAPIINLQGVLNINGVPYTLHTHSGVTSGPATTGPVVI